MKEINCKYRTFNEDELDSYINCGYEITNIYDITAKSSDIVGIFSGSDELMDLEYYQLVQRINKYTYSIIDCGILNGTFQQIGLHIDLRNYSLRDLLNEMSIYSDSFAEMFSRYGENTTYELIARQIAEREAWENNK